MKPKPDYSCHPNHNNIIASYKPVSHQNWMSTMSSLGPTVKLTQIRKYITC